MNEISKIEGSDLAAKPSIGSDMVTSRQAQEVQAAMVVAKKFPRNELDSINRIKQSCKRSKLAENALYSYPKGGQNVTGPSIRLAEMMAQNWGNLDFGIIELSQENGESQVMSYAWDLESNTRQTKIFSVPHMRHTRKGSYKLTDPREIYELVANQGARRLRACILGVIPGDVVDEALEECEKTLKGGNDKPIKERLVALLAAFAKFGVDQKMIESRLGHKLEVTTENEFISLRKIHNCLKDEMGSREDYFKVPQAHEIPESNPFDKAKPAVKESLSTAEESPEVATEATKEGELL